MSFRLLMKEGDFYKKGSIIGFQQPKNVMLIESKTTEHTER
jgi:hypothetical protein